MLWSNLEKFINTSEPILKFPVTFFCFKEIQHMCLDAIAEDTTMECCGTIDLPNSMKIIFVFYRVWEPCPWRSIYIKLKIGLNKDTMQDIAAKVYHPEDLSEHYYGVLIGNWLLKINPRRQSSLEYVSVQARDRYNRYN